MTSARPSGYLPTLDGWRAIAILGVIISHGTHRLFTAGAPLADPLWYRITQYGGKGVDLFFAISGFLICSRLLDEHERYGRISLKGFYVRRFARILPPYIVYLLALIAFAALGIMTLGVGELLASVLFFRNYYGLHETLGWYTSHLWSLSVEEHFYLLWPSLLVLWTPSRARARVVIFALVIAAWRVIEFRLRLLNHLIPDASFFLRTDVRLDALLWGCWTALVVRDPAWRERIRSMMAGALWWAAAAVTLACIVFPVPLAMLWYGLLMPLVVAGTTLNPGSAVSRVLEARPMRWIGRISYSLYLWQNLFLVVFGGPHFLGPLQEMPLNFVMCFIVAWISYQVVERPMIRLGHRLAPPATEGRA